MVHLYTWIIYTGIPWQSIVLKWRPGAVGSLSKWYCTGLVERSILHLRHGCDGLHMFILAQSSLTVQNLCLKHIHGTVVARWTADQQVDRSILHQGHVS